MIHPTRTNLLLLKDKSRSVVNSIAILKGRRQALIRELLSASLPLLRARDEIRTLYGRALTELQLSLGHEGDDFVRSLVPLSRRELGLQIVPRKVMGVAYRDVTVEQSPVRSPDQREYDFAVTTPHLEEAIGLFETVVEEMLRIAAFEAKLKRLGAELLRITRRIRVLEERIQPRLRAQIRSIAQYLGEREREAHYRLKLFKGKVVGG
ncbi:MAG: V-type ATP synthase subunit D [Desulfuromonas sp.]|uniref:V-type ATP synthase subunit D n=1 Tax=Desulfuromonas sp. TaxID=892 RepID=UPI000CA79CCE|nr:V-type ATP synthase subunit D [Desulfuromonas sp.]PLX83503.1 MAG: V-type ATP synthase subunit D [Desulfuromonas sp.]